MIKAVLFDIDGVLIDSFAANFQFYQTIMTQCGYRAPSEEEYKALFHRTQWDLIKTLTQAPDEEVNRVWEFAKSHRAELYPQHLLKYPDHAEQVLAGLSQEYQLGIVTSRLTEGIYSFPFLAQLLPYFAATVAYEDTLKHKPDPEPLLLACERLDAAPDQAVYVGDAETDVSAAQAAGTKVIFYAEQPNSRADASVQSFPELSEAVRSLS